MDSRAQSAPGAYDALKLKNQLCFPLYACARQVVKAYTPLLSELDLSYTQYITMMVLWEEGCVNVKEVGRRLFLDSGTLTPVLKSLEAKGFISRSRSRRDERVLLVEPTEAGWQLREKALSVPAQLISSSCLPLSAEQAGQLSAILWQILEAGET